MKSSSFLIACFLLTCTLSWGQAGSGGDLLQKLEEDEQEQIAIKLDSLLEVNYYKLLLKNSKIHGVPGFRILIYSESGIGAKEHQQRVRARFLSDFPGVDAYYRYDEPYFKVYVGDCRTRSEALKLFDMIKKKFPNSILREDNINIQ